jgi:predicted SprT family Zn-dependent metalloprotease
LPWTKIHVFPYSERQGTRAALIDQIPFHLRKEVIAHELTHFAFYDFCYGIGLKDSKKLWELSEIFNVLFLNIPSIQKAIGAEELLFYPDLKEKLENIRKIWNIEMPANDFIMKSLDLLN